MLPVDLFVCGSKDLKHGVCIQHQVVVEVLGIISLLLLVDEILTLLHLLTVEDTLADLAGVLMKFVRTLNGCLGFLVKKNAEHELGTFAELGLDTDATVEGFDDVL